MKESILRKAELSPIKLITDGDIDTCMDYYNMVNLFFNHKIHLSGLKIWLYAMRVQHPGRHSPSAVRILNLQSLTQTAIYFFISNIIS